MLSLLVYTQTPATLSVSINDDYQPLVTFLIYVERPFFVTNIQQFFLINTPRDRTLATILHSRESEEKRETKKIEGRGRGR